MRTAALFGALLAAALTLTGCDGGGGDRPEIVVTTNILGDLTAAVVGAAAEVTVLMPPDADPHSFAVSARQAATLERADLIVHNGLGLEEGVLRHVEAAAEAGVTTVAVGEHVDPLRYRPEVGSGRPDPHFWTDPRRVRTAVEVIRDEILTHVDGIDADAVRDRATRYLGEIDGLDSWMTEQFATLPPERRKLVTNHHVFGYLAQRFGFEVIGAVIPGGTALASPSPSDLAELAGAVRAAGVPTIFADSAQPDRLARVLAEQAGLHVRVVALYTESLTGPDGGAPTYLAMMRANTESIVRGLA
ncbi:zinc ABC transporter substrate-binding protein AztC [Nocardia puris]|uniref:Zinc/manganese transport system substrate-binding protein n=1 Tax=Nocardia puris TaxID=208602 RepID=A0A366DVZ4_9NOCA|nr:zinc ABC transporter substrate-binding protein AztC [Nocardia puris]RBO93699.1 zinc/manganese transport system substrate-binding protein [Nocardia puris]